MLDDDLGKENGGHSIILYFILALPLKPKVAGRFQGMLNSTPNPTGYKNAGSSPTATKALVKATEDSPSARGYRRLVSFAASPRRECETATTAVDCCAVWTAS